jgi:hypothetical protein
MFSAVLSKLASVAANASSRVQGFYVQLNTASIPWSNTISYPGLVLPAIAITMT